MQGPARMVGASPLADEHGIEHLNRSMGGAVGNGFTDAPMGKVKGEGERFGNWTAYAEFNVSGHREHRLWSRY